MSDIATRRPDPRVLEAMRPYFSDRFGNPSSQEHAYGEDARAAVEDARQAVATLIGAKNTRNIIFTSGGRESDHLAVHGVLESVPPKFPVRWITGLSEMHTSFRRPVEIVAIGAGGDGRIEIAELERTLRSGTTPATTTLVSVRSGEEHGLALDLPALCKMSDEHGALLHVSGAFALGQTNFCVQATRVDLVTIDGATLGTPPGVGALWIRRRSPPLKLQAQFPGGGQEARLRGGTLNVPGIVGLGAAATFIAERGSGK